MNNERLSENFTLEEFTRSDTATRLGIDNTPGEKELEALRILVERTLQPLRDRLGIPVHVNSGYRCPELNEAVGGVPTSQHQKGEAADLSVDGKPATSWRPSRVVTSRSTRRYFTGSETSFTCR